MAKPNSSESASESNESDSFIPESDMTLLLSPADQLEFWQMLNAPPTLTPAQQMLAAIMQGSRDAQPG